MSPFGVVVWRVRLIRAEAFRFAAFKEVGAEQCWEVKVITNLGEWIGFPTQLVPPSALPLPLTATAEQKSHKGVMVSIEASAPSSLAELSATACFPSLTTPFLKKLVVELQIVFERGQPSLEYDLCKILVQHLLPAATPEEVLQILSKRSTKKAPRFDCLDGAEIELAAGILDEAEVENATKDMKKYAELVKAEKAKMAAATKAAASRRRKPRQIPHRDCEAVETAKKLLPPESGCQLHLEATWHVRCRISYPKQFPPFSFFPEASMRSASLANGPPCRLASNGHGMSTMRRRGRRAHGFWTALRSYALRGRRFSFQWQRMCTWRQFSNLSVACRLAAWEIPRYRCGCGRSFAGKGALGISLVDGSLRRSRAFSRDGPCRGRLAQEVNWRVRSHVASGCGCIAPKIKYREDTSTTLSVGIASIVS